MVVGGIAIAYAIYRAYILITLNGTNVSNQSYLYDLSQMEPYYPSNYGYDIAFGVSGPIDPTIGTISVNFVNFYYSEQTKADGSKIRLKEKTLLKTDLCSDVGFNF